jgi:NADH-quinone oxidoreductase subunit M
LALGVMPSLVFDKINDSVLALVDFTKHIIR